MDSNNTLIDVSHMDTPKVVIHDDHEISMARAQVYRSAKHAMEIHAMLKKIDNLEGWMQSKLTLAADYLEAVASNLEYDIISATMGDESPINTGLMEAAKEKPADPKMLYAMRALVRQFNSAFTKGDISNKAMSEKIDMVANSISDITDRLAHHKSPFSDPASTKLGKIERQIMNHFEPLLKRVIDKTAEKGELKKAVIASVNKFGPKLVDTRRADLKKLPDVD